MEHCQYQHRLDWNSRHYSSFSWCFSHGGEKSNKCHQCNYGSSWADVLRTYLKTHSGEKSNCILWPLINHMVWQNGIFLNFLEHLKIHGSIWDFTGASVILLQRLRASVGFRNFDGASEIFRSVCGIYGTKKMPPWKNAPFSLHIQDRGVQGHTFFSLAILSAVKGIVHNFFIFGQDSYFG